MAYESNAYALKITLVAGADLSSAQYKFVKLDSNGAAVVCSAVTDVPVGVLQNNPPSGSEAEVLVIGGTKILAGGTCEIGATIGTTTAGKAATYAAGTDTTKYIVGTVLVATAGDGQIGTALINCAAPSRAA